MRRSLRAIGLMLSTTFRTSPLMATSVFLLTGMAFVSMPMRALGGKYLIDAATQSDLRAVIAWAAITALIAVVSHISATAGIGTMRMNMEERTRLHIERHIIELAGRIPGVEHHERRDYANEVELLRAGQGQIAQPAGPLVFLFGSVVTASGAFVLLAQLDPLLLLLPVLGIPSLIANAHAATLRKRTWEETVEDQRMAAVLFGLATTPAPAKEMRIFGLADELRGRLTTLHGRFVRAWTRSGAIGVALASAAWALFSLGYAGAIALVVVRVVDGRGTPGDVLLVLALAGQINGLVSQAASTVSWLGTMLGVMRRYVWLIDYAKDARPPIDEPVPVPQGLTRGIDIEDVSFTYPGSERPAIEHATLHVRAGSTLAIVGDNGAGKSTLVKLLCRFYEPDAGRILVDGVDLRTFEHESWRARLSAGFQDFSQFHFLAREAVGVGDIGRLDDAPVVSAALERARAADVLDSLPQGLETQLGKEFDDGVELSIGQWQKLALGRAMMRDAPLLLVLDEPTASLDAQTEHALFERYASGASRVARQTGAVTILVSHRFSTVRMADVIAVVDGGRVTECGSHAELMAQDGTYAELYRIQASAYRS